LAINASVRKVSIRSAIFMAMLAISYPLAYPVGVLVLGLLPPFELPDGQFWLLADDLVLDMPANWGFIVMGPVAFILRGETPQTVFQAVLFSSLAWLPIAAAYSWFTRRVRLLYVLLGVYPAIWFIGIGVVLLIERTFGYAGDTSM
jgi:hypothetical protein